MTNRNQNMISSAARNLRSPEEQLECIGSYSFSPEFAAVLNDPTVFFKKKIAGVPVDEFSGDLLDNLIQCLIDSEMAFLEEQFACNTHAIQIAEASMPAYLSRVHDDLDRLVDYDLLIEEQLEALRVLEQTQKGVK